MTGLYHLTKRNCKLFFKDKGLFFSALVTPLILLFLYMAFLANVYRDSFAAALPEAIRTEVSDKLIDATVGGQLVASLLAVCCITVAFCSNMLMVQDKVSRARLDLTVSPVTSAVLSVSYYAATLISTFFICLVGTGASMLYLASAGWYLSVADVLLILLDVLLLTVFGTALSGTVGIFLTSAGQISAVGTVVSAGYGFICGAYMPISQFGEGLQNVIAFLPGTYGTALLKNHALRGVFAEMERSGFPADVMNGIRDSIDCNLYVFGHTVPLTLMYVIAVAAALVSVLVYVLVSYARRRHA